MAPPVAATSAPAPRPSAANDTDASISDRYMRELRAQLAHVEDEDRAALLDWARADPMLEASISAISDLNGLAESTASRRPDKFAHSRLGFGDASALNMTGELELAAFQRDLAQWGSSADRAAAGRDEENDFSTSLSFMRNYPVPELPSRRTVSYVNPADEDGARRAYLPDLTGTFGDPDTSAIPLADRTGHGDVTAAAIDVSAWNPRGHADEDDEEEDEDDAAFEFHPSPPSQSLRADEDDVDAADRTHNTTAHRISVSPPPPTLPPLNLESVRLGSTATSVGSSPSDKAETPTGYDSRRRGSATIRASATAPSTGSSRSPASASSAQRAAVPTDATVTPRTLAQHLRPAPAPAASGSPRTASSSSPRTAAAAPAPTAPRPVVSPRLPSPTHDAGSSGEDSDTTQAELPEYRSLPPVVSTPSRRTHTNGPNGAAADPASASRSRVTPRSQHHPPTAAAAAAATPRSPPAAASSTPSSSATDSPPSLFSLHHHHAGTDLASAVAQLSQEVRSLTADRDTLRTRLDTVRGADLARIHALEKEIKSLKATLEIVHADRHAKSHEAARARRELEDARDRCRSLEDVVCEQRGMIEEFQAKVHGHAAAAAAAAAVPVARRERDSGVAVDVSPPPPPQPPRAEPTVAVTAAHREAWTSPRSPNSTTSTMRPAPEPRVRATSPLPDPLTIITPTSASSASLASPAPPRSEASVQTEATVTGLAAASSADRDEARVRALKRAMEHEFRNRLRKLAERKFARKSEESALRELGDGIQQQQEQRPREDKERRRRDRSRDRYDSGNENQYYDHYAERGPSSSSRRARSASPGGDHHDHDQHYCSHGYRSRSRSRSRERSPDAHMQPTEASARRVSQTRAATQQRGKSAGRAPTSAPVRPPAHTVARVGAAANEAIPVPFVVGKSAGKSFSVPVNLQRALSLAKAHAPHKCPHCPYEPSGDGTPHVHAPMAVLAAHLDPSPRIRRLDDERQHLYVELARAINENGGAAGVARTEQHERTQKIIRRLAVIEAELEELLAAEHGDEVKPAPPPQQQRKQQATTTATGKGKTPAGSPRRAPPPRPEPSSSSRPRASGRDSPTGRAAPPGHVPLRAIEKPLIRNLGLLRTTHLAQQALQR
ncbi:hypothetical protein H9P43_007804 [Blastocladiella emersonii ATCC 22665]|nr:hypothetical protein H9P43_007804 [Blastocladiella emersonii ATCC 22665]